jgi:hypothetical protein
MKWLLRGTLAGIAGTGAMTGYQLAVARLRGKPLATPVPERWTDAPAPAQVAKKAADAVGQGRRVALEHVPLLTDAMHWLYGMSWGVLFGAAGGHVRADPVVAGLALGGGVWAASYAELVPLGVYEPPWRYPLQELALDLSYHLVYGIVVASSLAALGRD